MNTKPDIDILEQIAHGLAYGEYSLLLGAGASMGATGGNGRQLPNAPGLRDALISEFKIETEGETITLSRAYEIAWRRNAPQLDSYLSDWFTNCKPTWQHLLTDFGWRHIWTLNIDDVLERAFDSQGRAFRSFAWGENFTDPRASQQDQIIHLHGFAGASNKTASDRNRLIFSLRDYVRVVAEARSWHRVFFDELADTPFVIIGASLSEEFDLVEALHQGTTAEVQTGYPSAVVLRSVTSLQKEELESYGLNVVQSDGEEFIRELLSRYQVATSSLKETYGGKVSSEAARFLQQFVDLRRHEPPESNRPNFYAGYEPTWATITAKDDAILEPASNTAKEVGEAVTSDDVKQEIHILSGRPGTGKTAALLRVGHDLIATGARPFLFRGEEALDQVATMEWLQAVPRSVLLFDACGDFSRSLQALAEACQAEGIRMIAVGTERSRRLRSWVRPFISADFLRAEQDYVCGHLSDMDINALIDKLESRGRLGRITRLRRADQQSYFSSRSNRRLFDAMADLERGMGFRARIRQAYETIRETPVHRIYVASCIAYDLGIVLPSGIAATLGNIHSRSLSAIIAEHAADVLELTRDGVKPPHRIGASIVVREILSGEERYSSTLSMIKALAPHVSRRSIASQTRTFRLARHLMNQDNVRRYAGSERARAWYDQLVDDYSWNGRYWEQRALLESKLGDNSTALSFAERAVDVHGHPYAFNTLGTIQLRLAVETGALETFKEGIRSLERARGPANWDSGHPYVTFFSSVLHYAQRWGLDALPTGFRNAWPLWMREATKASPFSHPEGQEELENFQRQWLMLAT